MIHKDIDIKRVIETPKVIGSVSQTCYRSYDVLQYVMKMLKRGDSYETILDMIAFMMDHGDEEK